MSDINWNINFKIIKKKYIKKIYQLKKSKLKKKLIA